MILLEYGSDKKISELGTDSIIIHFWYPGKNLPSLHCVEIRQSSIWYGGTMDWPNTHPAIWWSNVKVQLFWEGHKNLKKSPTCFDPTE